MSPLNKNLHWRKCDVAVREFDSAVCLNPEGHMTRDHPTSLHLNVDLRLLARADAQAARR